MSIPARRPAGSPAGGQFAPTSHAEADVDLSPPPVEPIDGLTDRQTAEIAAYEENERGRWAIVERVWEVQAITGDTTGTGFRTTGFDSEQAMREHLESEGFKPSDLENPDEAPDVDYWTDPQPVVDDRSIAVARTRTVEVFEPDV